MRRHLMAGLLLLLLVTSGCGGSDDDEVAEPSPSATAAGASPSPSVSPSVSPSASASASGSYVAQVNALCEAMIPDVMGVRGDDDGDGGGNIPKLDEFAAEEEKLKPIIAKFDAAVAAIEVTDADRTAADALKAYQATSDAEAAKSLAAAKSGDQKAYEESLQPSAEWEAKRQALEAAGISCPAR